MENRVHKSYNLRRTLPKCATCRVAVLCLLKVSELEPLFEIFQYPKLFLFVLTFISETAVFFSKEPVR